ncbi:lymphocyte function-associated antigen 3-like [Nelusetta ayraudi]|uniref:lymphocyte function-associated antigen 3-like n=1 Tax=Nelusetta ayraudi TaxID=303726 RepID=UPI003F7129FC
MDTAGLLHLVLEVLAVLALTMSQVSAQSDINVVEGGNLILELDPKQETLERVVWKHGANLLAEMTLGEFSYYGSFKGHTVLEDSGRLTVSNINQTEGGEYSMEVNNVIQAKRYNVRVFEKLGRPTIRVTPLICGPGLDDCTLVCELDGEPSQDVSYEWQLAGEESRIPGKKLIIDQNIQATDFTCWAKNPVSEEASESQKNPLITSPITTVVNDTLWITIVGVSAGILLIALAAFLCWFIKNRNVVRWRARNSTQSDPQRSGKSAPMNKDTEPKSSTRLNSMPQNETETTLL